MKTILLFFGVFFAATISAQRLPFGIDGGRISTWSFPVTQVFFITDLGLIYPPPHTMVERYVSFPQHTIPFQKNVLPYRFRRPDAAVFCRMEDFTAKNYRVMFSLHAGGYRE